MRTVARAILTLLLIGSLALSGWRGWLLMAHPLASPVWDRTLEEIEQRAESALAREATPERTEARLGALLGETPRNWLAIEAVGSLAAERGIAISPELAARRQAAHAADFSVGERAGRCARCLWDTSTCSLQNVLYCKGPVLITPVDDVIVVTREGIRFLLGDEVDTIELGLSVIGLAAVAVVPLTGGVSTSVKVGAGFGKVGYRMGRLSRGLMQPLERAVREGVDWGRLHAVRSLDDFAPLLRPQVVQPAAAVVSDFGHLRAATGVRHSLHLLQHADTPADLRRISNTAEALKRRTVGAFELLGRSRIMRLTMRHGDVMLQFVGGLFGFLVALVSLFWSMFYNLTMRLLRRLARAPHGTK